MQAASFWLGGGFKYFLMFTPIWGRFPFWLIFFEWVELKPPTTSSCLHPGKSTWNPKITHLQRKNIIFETWIIVFNHQLVEAMTTTWSFGLPANPPVMPPWLPFHDPRGVAVAEVMKTNASRGPGGLHQRAERKTHQPLKGVDDVFCFFFGLGGEGNV